MMSTQSKVSNNEKKIIENKCGIRENKNAISEIKSTCATRCLPLNVFDTAVAKYDRIVHRLIIVLAFVIILLFVSNAAWLYAWNTADNKNETTVITKDGNANIIGRDGGIGE